MRKFLPPHRTLNEQELAQAKARLAKEVLFEVPGQLIGYMKVLTTSMCQTDFELVERHLPTKSR